MASCTSGNDNWQQLVNERLPPSKTHPRIAIFGSVDFFHKDSPFLCDEIGKFLARELPHACILTGANAITQERLSKAFWNEWHLSRNQAEEERNGSFSSDKPGPLVFHLAPVGYTCDFEFGTHLDAGEDMERRRYVLANSADACVSIEGGPGTVDEMKKALTAGKPLIPLIRTGGASAGMFDAPPRVRPASVEESLWSLLVDETASVQACAQAVVSCIKCTLSAMNAKTALVRRATAASIEKIVSGSLDVTYSKRPTLSDSANAYVEPSLANCAHLVFAGSEHSGADQSFGNIYLGPKVAAEPSAYNQLKDANIGAIVNCTMELPCHFRNEEVSYCNVTVRDIEFADISIFLKGATTFINYHICRGVSVLVHCERGVSRSATVVIAYLIRFWRMTRDKAYLHVKARRPMANPNPGFWDQLLVFEEQCSLRDNPPPLEMPPFDGDWAQKANAVFATCREIPNLVENDDAIGRVLLINNNEKREHLLFVCLDFIWRRGLQSADLDWIAFVCQVLDRNTILDSSESAAERVRAMLQDQESDFWYVWSGEIYEEQTLKVLQKLGL